MSSNAAAQPSKKTLLSLAFGKDCIRHEEGKEKKRKRERKKERKKERKRERKKEMLLHNRSAHQPPQPQV